MTFSERDLAIVLPLATGQIPLWGMEQVERQYPTSKAGGRECRRRVSLLCEHRLLERHSVLAKPLPPIRGPVHVWELGDAEPQCAALAYTLQSRWTEPARRTTVLVAGPRVPALLGGLAGRVKHLMQVSHDLLIAEAFLLTRRDRPELAARWVGEPLIAPTRATREGEKLPDAMIVDAAGFPVRVIESGGAYPEDRVSAFVHDCVERRLPFEIW